MKPSPVRYYQRRSALPTSLFPGGEHRRLLSLVLALLVLGMMYRYARDPNTWRWLAPLPEEKPAAEPRPAAGKADAQKKLDQPALEGPTDLTAGEMQEAKRLFQALSDKQPLSAMEMPTYWKLMRWSRAQTFAQMEARAQKEVFITRYYEEPEKHRGKLIRLRVHVKRILDYDAPENKLGVKKAYEFWGWTDESKSYPYVLVTDQLPDGWKVGADVRFEGVFVGYFMKSMGYVAFQKNRSAPLLIGKIRHYGRELPAGGGAAVGPKRNWNDPWFLGVAGLVLAAGAWFWLRRPKTKPLGAPIDDSTVESWLATGDPVIPDDPKPRPGGGNGTSIGLP